MKTGSTKPEWDTPPHGDFASYVELLTAPKPKPVNSAPAAARLPPGVAASKSPLFLSGVGPAWGSWMGGLRVARAVLLVLLGLQGVALMFWGRGSFAGLLATGMLWWILGWLLDIAPKILRVPGLAARADPQSLPDRLRQVSPQRNTGKKK